MMNRADAKEREPSPPDSPGRPIHPPGPSPIDARLEELRDLLVDAERRQIAGLRRRLDEPETRVRELLTLLPRLLRSLSPDDPTVAQPATALLEKTVRKSIREDPAVVSDVLYPVLGPLIWTAVSRAFHNLMESLNKTLELSLTPRGLSWRWEAYRTGKSVGEIALSRNLIYRVEHVYLIDRDSGRLLQSAGADQVAHDDELMSAMLTAIQDFVRDSFVAGPEELDTLRVGDFTVWIERGPKALLGAVIRGWAPPDLRETLQGSLRRIHLSFADELDAFTGDSSQLAACRPLLDECLRQESQTAAPRQPVAAYVVTTLAILGAIALVLQGWRAEARVSAFLDHLRAEPGLVVLAADAGRAPTVSVLQDPLAPAPAALLVAHGLDTKEIRLQVKPYLSLEPTLVVRRARDLLRPPGAVSMGFARGTLHVAGSAPPPWIATLQERARWVPGVSAVDQRALRPSLSAWQVARHAVESTVILFGPGDAEATVDPSRLATLATQITDVIQALRAQGSNPFLEIRGSTDPSGSAEVNQRLSARRAEWAHRVLRDQGLPPDVLRRTVLRVRPDDGDLPSTSQQRSVTFRVIAEDPPREP